MVSLNGYPISASLYLISFFAIPNQIRYRFQTGWSSPNCIRSFSKTFSESSIPPLSFVTDVVLEPSPDCILASLICITACSKGPLGTDCNITKTRRVVPKKVGIIRSNLLTT